MSDTAYLVIIAILLVISAYLVFKIRRMLKPDGQIVVRTDPDTGSKIFSLELDKSPEEIEIMRNVSFKIAPVNGLVEDPE